MTSAGDEDWVGRVDAELVEEIGEQLGPHVLVGVWRVVGAAAAPLSVDDALEEVVAGWERIGGPICTAEQSPERWKLHRYLARLALVYELLIPGGRT